MPEKTSSSSSVSAIIEAGDVRIPCSAVRIRYSRASGPGGQNVNKVNSRCELWVPVSQIVGLSESAARRLRQLTGFRLTIQDEIHIDAQQSRSRESNRQAAIERLRQLIFRALIEPKKRKKTRPTAGSQQRRLSGKKRRSEIKKGRSALYE